MGAEVETTRLIGIGVDPALARAASDPMQLTAEPLFNPQGGYATYVLPGAFVLLLQQILLVGVGLLGTLPGPVPAENATDGPPPRPFATVAGKMLAYLLLGAVILPLYLIAALFLRFARLGVVPVSSRRAVCPFHQRARPCRSGDLEEPLVGSTCPAAIGLPFLPRRFACQPGDPTRCPCGLVLVLAPPRSMDSRSSPNSGSAADVRGEFLTLWALTLFYGGIA